MKAKIKKGPLVFLLIIVAIGFIIYGTAFRITVKPKQRCVLLKAEIRSPIYTHSEKNEIETEVLYPGNHQIDPFEIVHKLTFNCKETITCSDTSTNALYNTISIRMRDAVEIKMDLSFDYELNDDHLAELSTKIGSSERLKSKVITAFMIHLVVEARTRTFDSIYTIFDSIPFDFNESFKYVKISNINLINHRYSKDIQNLLMRRVKASNRMVIMNERLKQLEAQKKVDSLKLQMKLEEAKIKKQIRDLNGDTTIKKIIGQVLN